MRSTYLRVLSQRDPAVEAGTLSNRLDKPPNLISHDASVEDDNVNGEFFLNYLKYLCL